MLNYSKNTSGKFWRDVNFFGRGTSLIFSSDASLNEATGYYLPYSIW